MGLTFAQLVDRFLKGDTKGVSGGGGNLMIKNDQLIHFSTVIAERYEDKTILNVTRYSLQTGILQKILYSAIKPGRIIEVHRVPKNYLGKLARFVND